ncbi:MAG TPA: universal stress protein [Methylomirabilota bacterium]|jgi:nucleotide-binding universal stress UspA family protein|nr:universal stress protein [Methylomirabilota bacterium]
MRRKRILVPLDGSPGSEVALFHAAELARAERATLHLLHVTAPVRATVAPDGRVLAYADQVAARVAQDVRAYLTEAAAAVSDVDVELAVRFGDPADEILWEAKSGRIDLIAMATHRRTGLRRLVMGSVAERVVRAAPVPVLLMEHGEELVGAKSERAEADAGRAPAGVRGRVVRRRFWCASRRRDVEVEFVERGLPGFAVAVAVRSCSAFDPPTAIDCRRQCADAAFRRQWEPPLPLYSPKA